MSEIAAGQCPELGDKGFRGWLYPALFLLFYHMSHNPNWLRLLELTFTVEAKFFLGVTDATTDESGVQHIPEFIISVKKIK